ncbi:MAG: S-adenosylmethionine tRNA ribosyltransferase, partial [Bacteroidetes bacterium]
MKKAPLSSIKEITISDYDYALPPERIAWYPPKERGTSKLLVSTSGHHIQVPFADIGAHLPPKATLVFNETKVVQARMHFTKSSGAHIEIFCLEPLLPVAEVQLAFSQPSPVTWKCLVGNSRRWKQGALETTISVEGRPLTIKATRTAQHEGYSEITFHWDNETMPFGRVLESIGTMPLPPYIHREAEPEDQERYQTVYARNDGSVAAPTAGLHFTETLLASLEKQGISKEKITLHVGAGTFRPVTSPTLGEHCMHTE